MQEINFSVQGMTCQKCVKAVTEAVESVDPQAEVEVELESGRVAAMTHFDPEAIQQAITAAGYPATLLEA